MAGSVPDSLNPTFGQAAALLTTGPVGYVADKTLNDGAAVKAMDRFGDRAGHEMSGINRRLGKVWDGVAGVAKKAGQGLSDATSSPAGNPLMQTLAALGAGILTWKIAPTLLSWIIPGDGPISNTLRGLFGLVAVGLVAYGAATGVGMLRDDPEFDSSSAESIEKDAKLTQPPQKLVMMPF